MDSTSGMKEGSTKGSQEKDALQATSHPSLHSSEEESQAFPRSQEKAWQGQDLVQVFLTSPHRGTVRTRLGLTSLSPKVSSWILWPGLELEGTYRKVGTWFPTCCPARETGSLDLG